MDQIDVMKQIDGSQPGSWNCRRSAGNHGMTRVGRTIGQLIAQRIAQLVGPPIAQLIVLLVVLTPTGTVAAQDPPSRPVVVCSTTQIADFARQVVGDRWRVDCILAPEQDPHTYTPTFADAEKTKQATLCLANGWHLEGKEWMETLARDHGKPVVHCVDHVTGLPGGEAGAHDPHAWFSPVNAQQYVVNIVTAVSQLDPDHAAEYQARGELYRQQLRTLHLWIKQQVNQVPPEQRILVTSHDAFQYFCHAYGFKSAAPLSWSTAELGGATVERRAAAVAAIRESGVRAIFVETSVKSPLIEQIAQETQVKLGGKLYSDAMGSPDSAGGTYIGMMRENVLTILQGLR